MPYFSIIIPTYNRSSTILKTIESVLSQTFQNFEIIIIDDGSTDNTFEEIEHLKTNKIIYKRQKNNERANARNNGIALANGDYITFLDSDDLFYTAHLQIAYEAITTKNNPEVLHTRYEIIDQDGKVIEKKNILDSNLNKNLISGNFMSCNGVFLRKDIAASNLFNEDRELSGLEDWELWLRIASQYKIQYSNIITSAIVNHNSRSVLTTNKNELILRIKALLKHVLMNKNVVNYYDSEFYKLKSSCYSYIALHIALTKKDRLTTIKYLFKGIKENPKSLFSKRLFATLKHFI